MAPSGLSTGASIFAEEDQICRRLPTWGLSAGIGATGWSEGGRNGTVEKGEGVANMYGSGLRYGIIQQT